MTRDEAIAILSLPRDEAADRILALAEKAEKYDQLYGQVTPSTPSGMTPPVFKAYSGQTWKTARKEKRP